MGQAGQARRIVWMGLVMLGVGFAGVTALVQPVTSQGQSKTPIFLQPTTPGTQQAGNGNISGTFIAGGSLSAVNGQVRLVPTPNGAGGVVTTGPNGSFNVVLGDLAGQPNHGSVTVLDAAGTSKAIMYVTAAGQGLVQADIINASTINATTKNFRIDDPLDPANKYLVHSCVESDERVNVYSGNVTTNQNGNATVLLPDWCEALNRDFRYQLTVIGQFAQAVVAARMHNNRFTIKTDKPNVEVSWQVAGVRQDAYAKAHPMEVEVYKQGDERGKYLHPELYGKPKELSINCVSSPRTQIGTSLARTGR